MSSSTLQFPVSLYRSAHQADPFFDNSLENGAGPQIGPAVPDVPLQSSAPTPQQPPQPTTLSTGASISAGPQPASAFLSTPAPPASHLNDGGSPLPPSAPITLPAGLPQRPNVATPGEALPGAPAPPPQPTTRPAEDDLEGEPSAKRSKTAAEGELVPEAEWLQSHPDPVKVGVQLPDYPAKPAWGCDGKKLELEVPLSLLVGTMRDRIAVGFAP